MRKINTDIIGIRRLSYGRRKHKLQSIGGFEKTKFDQKSVCLDSIFLFGMPVCQFSSVKFHLGMSVCQILAQNYGSTSEIFAGFRQNLG